MKVLVLGAGKIGYGIAKEMSLNGHDVVVVDHDQLVLDKVAEKLDVKPVFGHASDIGVLKESGLEETDILISVTPFDEVNITACQIADVMSGTELKIARIDKRSYFDSSIFVNSNKFPIDFTVSPYIENLHLIRRSVSISSALDVISCVDGKLKVIGVTCKKGSALANVPLKYISSIDEQSKIAILYIRKKNEIHGILPGKRHIIEPDDTIYFVCSENDTKYAMNLFGYEADETNSVVIVGGGSICEEISNLIVSLDVDVKIIEENFNVAEVLAEKFEAINIVHGNPLDSDVLRTANISETGIVISMTEDDKTNILACLLAKKLGAKRCAAVLNNISYCDLLYTLGINAILDSRSAIISKILHHIRKGGTEDVLNLEGDEIEIIVIEALNNSYIIGTFAKKLLSKNEVLIAAIVRNNEISMLPKKKLINAGDRILLAIRKNATNKVLNLFQAKPKYLA
ncbi:MAG: Trk system potassium transporter TrkA [Holosporales bacterium]|jgi:trk system potassium uptake protein TrkA|nr:Trk system potassium transporter TrkA [Holosporales bacterium]